MNLNFYYWATEAENYFKRLQAEKDNNTLWGAFCCCTAAMVEYDRRKKHPLTNKWQAIAWRMALQRKEVSFDEVKKSGWLDDIWYAEKDRFFTPLELFEMEWPGQVN